MSSPPSKPETPSTAPNEGPAAHHQTRPEQEGSPASALKRIHSPDPGSPPVVKRSHVEHEQDPSQDVSPMLALPPEVLEKIFSYLPAQTLLQTANRVCARWNDIIRRDGFAFWKKSYLRFKLYQFNITQLPTDFVSLYNSSIPDEDKDDDEAREDSDLEVLSVLLKRVFAFLNNHFSKIDFSGVEEHKRFNSVKKNLVDGPLAVTTGIHLSTVATICFVADDTWELRSLIGDLLRTTDVCYVSELLYCIAIILLGAKRVVKLPLRLHFNLFQALYLFENDWKALPKEDSAKPKKASGLLAFKGFTREVVNEVVPTAEQQQIISHKIDTTTNSVTRIVAFAGTGKTTTLIRLCEENKNLKFLAMMYNKAVKDEAKKRFPSNVLCYTAHGMAMTKEGFKYAKKLTSNLKAKDLSDLAASEGLITELKDSDKKNLSDADVNRYRHCAQVVKTLEAFMNSADDELSLEHVPSLWGAKGPASSGVDQTLHPVPERVQQWVLRDANSVWECMSNPDDPRVRVPHDGYLKMWQLRTPSLQYVKRHPRAEVEKMDVLLIDEGQDMNPAMLDIFIRQEMPVVIVGDPHQQVYMFRGAVNALSSFSATKTFYLTQSFRFGPEIAHVANCCLDTLKKEDRRTLVGGKKRDRIDRHALEMLRGNSLGKKGETIAFIARSNSTLLQHAISLFCNGLSGANKISPRGHFAGGIDSYNLNDYLDILLLQEGKQSQMKKWKNFKSFADFENFAKNTSDQELLSKLSVVSQYSGNPDLLRRNITKILHACRAPKASEAFSPDVVFSTAHKAKGLEWDTVYVLEDFTHNIFGLSGSAEEQNLLYVAVTRAKRTLALSHPVRELLRRSDAIFYFLLVPSEDIPKKTCCIHCLKRPEQGWHRTHFSLKRPAMSLQTDVAELCTSGYVCPNCLMDFTFPQKRGVLLLPLLQQY